MKTRFSNQTLSPRGSKLLVELVIGVVGLLGIMLAHSIEPTSQTEWQTKKNGQIISIQEPVKIDWLEILL